MDYVLGYTACNDVSSRTYQLNQSQWCFAKGFDGSCPLGNALSLIDCFRGWKLISGAKGPTLVSKDLIPDPAKLRIRGVRNGEVLQDSGIKYVIPILFDVEYASEY